MKKSYYRFAKNGVRILLTVVFFILLLFYFDKEYMTKTLQQLLHHPVIVLVVLGIYFFSFFLKGIAWKLYLNDEVRLSSCLIGLFYSLLFNHLLPLKVGDGLRVMVMNQREKHISVERSFHSVVVLRVMDTLLLLLLAGCGLFFFPFALKLPGFLTVGLVIVFIVAAWVLLQFITPDILSRHVGMLKHALSGGRGLLVAGLILSSWVLEGAILYGVSMIILEPLSMGAAIWVNSVTIIGQLFQFAPGGLGTYESVMSYTLLSAGIPLGKGLSMAILSHGLKFIFSFAVGGIVIALSPVSIKQVKQWGRMKG